MGVKIHKKIHTLTHTHPNKSNFFSSFGMHIRNEQSVRTMPAQVGLFHGNNHKQPQQQNNKVCFPPFYLYFELVEFFFRFQIFLKCLGIGYWQFVVNEAMCAHTTETMSLLHCWFVSEKHKKSGFVTPEKMVPIVIILLVVFVFSFALLCSSDRFSTNVWMSERIESIRAFCHTDRNRNGKATSLEWR